MKQVVQVQVVDRDSIHWPKHSHVVANEANDGSTDYEYEFVCFCGFRGTAMKMLSHIETWNYLMGRGPIWQQRTSKGSQETFCINTTPQVPGHSLSRYRNWLQPRQFRVVCSCGWSTKYRATRGVREARLHIEEECCTILGLDVEAIRRERRERREQWRRKQQGRGGSSG